MKGTVIQLGSSMILALLTFKSGFANVWPSYAMPMLQSDDSPIGYPITDLQANIISSIPMLASIISTLLTGYISEALGRKRTQLLCALIYLTSWTLITTARTATQIIIGRFIIGLSGGMALVSVVIYISEITELSNRGSGATVVSLFTNVGMTMSYIEGWFFDYDVICYLSISGTLVFVVMMVCLKESPSWLVKCGRDKEALTALKFYRGKSETTDAILEELSYLKSQAHPYSIRIKNGVDIKSYCNLTAYLKRLSDGFRSKKSKMVLSSDDVEKFIKDAPDNQYLATKVGLIFGVTGACRIQVLAKISIKDVENHGQVPTFNDCIIYIHVYIDSGKASAMETSREQLEDSEKRNPWIELVTVDYNRRALITSVTFMIFAVLTGMVAVQTYAIQFFSRAVPSISPDLCSVLLGLVLVLTSCVTMLVTDLVPRRTLMISTAITSTICLTILGAAMRWPEIPVWVAPLAVIIYCICYQLGLINIVFIQIAESFGPQVNSAAAAIAICIMFATNFFLLFSFSPAVEYFGIDVTFFIFASLGGVITVLAYFFMKETRRVPVENIQKMFSKGFLCTSLEEITSTRL